MMTSCVDTFCFLSAAVMATYFSMFVVRNPAMTVHDIYQHLGVSFHLPAIYFRFGYNLMVVSLSGFFLLVMDYTETGSCLGFCIVALIGPMWISVSRALRNYELVPDSTSKPPVKKLAQVTDSAANADRGTEYPVAGLGEP